jgi:2-succinyl-6-hydroxy-2,4-cyclohexadiene-1-carboxylate synthase
MVMSDWRPLSGPLAAECLGDGPRIVFAHGFTQTRESWKPIGVKVAAAGYEAVVVDLPGHGESANVRADLRRGAQLLTTVGGEATYVGYSMGGRFCLHAALMYPHLVKQLVLIGTHPGLDDDDDRVARRAADDVTANRLAEIGLPAFLDEWVRQPLFDGLQLDPADRASRLTNTVEGLRSSLWLAGTGAQDSLWPRLAGLAMPVALVTGTNDLKFHAISAQMAELLPDCRRYAIDGAGHAAHLQQPAAVTNAIVETARRS